MVCVEEYKVNPKYDKSKVLKDKKSSLQFLPSKLAIESLSKTLIYKDTKLKTSYLIDIVHNLILKYYFKKDNIFHLSSLILKEKYGYLYNYYIQYLTEKNILVLIRNHKKGKNARVYKLSEDCLKTPKRFRNEDKVLIKKYKNALNFIESNNIDKNNIDAEIKKKLVQDLFFVEIDFSRSIFYLDSTIQDSDIYERNRYSVECINDKHIFYHFDNYGRMHTNFTILKSFIRKNCLLIEGEETFEIDIKNSQPMFLNKIIEIWGKDKVDENEFSLFRDLTRYGTFYQYIMDVGNIKTKQEAKDLVYNVFFGKNYKTKFDIAFSKIFPTIYNFIKFYKKMRGDYKSLAYDLQNLESDLIFNKIIKELNDINPNIRLITVHDSIICKKSDREMLESVFYKHLSNEFKW